MLKRVVISLVLFTGSAVHAFECVGQYDGKRDDKLPVQATVRADIVGEGVISNVRLEVVVQEPNRFQIEEGTDAGSLAMERIERDPHYRPRKPAYKNMDRYDLGTSFPDVYATTMKLAEPFRVSLLIPKAVTLSATAPFTAYLQRGGSSTHTTVATIRFSSCQ